MSYEEQKALSRKQKKLEKAVKEAEERVSQLDAALKILENQMSTPAGSTDMSLYEKHTNLKKQLEEAEAEWESAMMELEN